MINKIIVVEAHVQPIVNVIAGKIMKIFGTTETGNNKFYAEVLTVNDISVTVSLSYYTNPRFGFLLATQR